MKKVSFELFWAKALLKTEFKYDRPYSALMAWLMYREDRPNLKTERKLEAVFDRLCEEGLYALRITVPSSRLDATEYNFYDRVRQNRTKRRRNPKKKKSRS